jgi:hypothetical protein
MDRLQEDFNKVIEFSQDLEKINTDDLFAQWRKAKADFIEYFGGKLIYEWPEKVTFELDNKEKDEKIKDFINYVGESNSSLAEFIRLNTNSFYQNTVNDDYYVASSDSYISKGMRLLKAFKFFETDKERLTDFQNKASMVIQENKVEGRLCFSVHPLDFLSASENTHNWHSCHALDGDYRAGNLSYMTDSCTIMVYLKSDEDTLLPDFPDSVKWNSKKWRMWLFFSNNRDMLFAGRQYPFFSRSALDFITKKVFAETDIGANAHRWGEWNNKFIEDWDNQFPLNGKYLPVGESLICLNDLVRNNTDSLHYNDLLYSSYYVPYYCYKYPEPNNDPWIFYNRQDRPVTKMHSKFWLGGSVKCLKCNTRNITDSYTMLCPDCELKYGHCENDDICTCDVCGQRIYRDDAYWLDGPGDWVCEDCSHLIASCECCGEYDYIDNMIKADDGSLYCKDCYSEIKEN